MILTDVYVWLNSYNEDDGFVYSYSFHGTYAEKYIIVWLIPINEKCYLT